MRKLRHILLVLAVTMLAFAGTAQTSAAKGETDAPDQLNVFAATLSGSQEVPANESRARGAALFRLNSDGTALNYLLVGARIQNVSAGHIHMAPVGTNGPVVAGLINEESCRMWSTSFICHGTVTAEDLTGPLAGHPLSDLIDAMTNGQTYTNVHTTQYPGGEMRGQISGPHLRADPTNY